MSSRTQPVAPVRPSDVRIDGGDRSNGSNGSKADARPVPETALEALSPAPSPRILALSPHPDDAVWSIGGLLHRLSQSGFPVTVVTVFSHAPNDQTDSSPLAAELHARWSEGGAADDPMADRREEDLVACQRLGIGLVGLGFHDAIYRRSPDGVWLIEDEAGLFDPGVPDEPELVAEIATRLEATLRSGTDAADAPSADADTLILAPHGVGGHVDHRRTREAAEALASRVGRLVTYEELPYGFESEADAASPLDIPLSGSDVGAKLAASVAYVSQVSTFWADEVEMVAAFWRHARLRGADRDAAEQTDAFNRLLGRADAVAVEPGTPSAVPIEGPPLAERLWLSD